MTYIWHELKLRGKQPRVIGSAAANLDEAYSERCKIAANYHPNQIETLTTHTRTVEDTDEV